jgi:pimeloyl-ACP methyl ester carboxylesterase
MREMSFISVQGHRLEFEFSRAGPVAPVIVFLHEGLGSLAMWRDFPRRIVQATGCDALVYSRFGYGQSDPIAAPRRADFMHEEALKSLPELLDKLCVENPILFGHSDGASIAIIHAGASKRPVRALVLMAPHVMVEDVAIRSITAARDAYQTTDLREKLGRYHDDPDSAFRGWNDIWLDPSFRNWNIEQFLSGITCPILAIQGEDDEYGTMAQIERVARIATRAELLKLARCRHSPHRDQPDAVIDATRRFVAGLECTPRNSPY